MTAMRPLREPTPPELRGLGGWLVLPCIGMFLTVIVLVNELATTFLPIFTDGTWEALTTPGAEAYHHLWGPLLLSEIVMNLAQLAFEIFLLVLFFTKHRFFPKGIIASYLFSILVQLIDSAMVSAMPEGLIEESLGTPEIVKSAFVAAIWTGYFLKSERVKNTFVN